MTIKLKRVELKNIRSHEHLIFEPKIEGLTAISGPNGTGKSTIVDSIAWALYGTKPAGVSKASAIFRDAAEFGQEQCYVIVDLEVESKDIRIKRKMVTKGGGVECEVIEKNSETGQYENVVAGPAVSHAEKHIRNLLKMDEKGFLAAILVQQKNVDQLISSGPRERAEVIEKLTGISSITKALVSSRQEANILKKAASVSSVDEASLESYKKEYETLRRQTEKIKNEIYTNNTKINDLHVKGKELAKKFESLENDYNLHQNVKEKLSLNKTLIANYEDELSKVINEKDAKKKKLSNLTINTDIAPLELKISELKEEIAQEKVFINSHKKQASELKETIVSDSLLIKESKINTIDDALATKDKKEKEMSSASETIKSVEQKNIELLSGVKKTKNAINIIKNENGDCPTCLQKLSDVDVVISALELSNQKAENEIKKNKKQLSELKEKFDQVSKDKELIDSVIVSLSRVEKYENELNTIRLKLIPESESKIKDIEKELKSIEKIYLEVKNHEEIQSQYNNLLKSAQNLISKIDTLRKENESIDSSLVGVKKVSKDLLENTREKVNKARTVFNSLRNKKTELSGEFNVLKERINNCKNNISREEENIKKHKLLLKSVETATSTTNVIEAFRADRIKNSVPVIELYASELLNRFTEGKFTRLKMDQKFNATVILANGSERPVGLLSGGELSAASIALRLAVSMLLNGGQSQSLMILDEVLVSQDSTRSELIMSTIKDVCKGQVVLIAHNENIDDIADKVVELH